MTQEPDCRRSIIEALSLLSSPEKQHAYERNVPHVRVVNELLSAWFDDTYLLNSEAFRQSFSDEELAGLAAFDRFYDEHSRLLPESASVTDWLNNENWQQIIARAGETLALLKG